VVSGAAPDVFGIVGTVQSGVFDVERAVAEGGFGVVYRAHHKHFRAPVALKCLKVPDAIADERRDGFLEKFRAEAELLFRLSAALPEVVRPLQFGVLDTKGFVPFIALEWLEGETLDAFVSRRTEAGLPPLGLADALDLLAPVAKALARAHQFSDKKGAVTIVHRDMKPENVFLAEADGETTARILDFGIARVRDEAGLVAGRQTAGDAIAAFSPPYAAPEQWAPGQYGATGPWTDVYGLGLTLAEVLVGAPTVQGDLTAMMTQAMNPRARPVPANRGRPLGAAADVAMARALAVDPRERTQSVEAFWNELERAAGRAPSALTKRARGPNDFATASGEHVVPDLLSESAVRHHAATLPATTASTGAAPPAAPSPIAPSPAARLPAPAAAPRLEDADRLPFSSSLEVDRPRAMRPATRPRRQPESAAYVPPGAAGPPLGERMRGPAWLFFLALAIAGVDIVLQQSGMGFTLGPVRVAWVAGAIGAAAVLMAFFRAFEH
jgi:serine/threonine-protein kinase